LNKFFVFFSLLRELRKTSQARSFWLSREKYKEEEKKINNPRTTHYLTAAVHKERKQREKQTLTMLPPFSVCIPSRHHPVDAHTQNTCRRILHTVFHYLIITYFYKEQVRKKQTQNAIINTHFFSSLSLSHSFFSLVIGSKNKFGLSSPFPFRECDVSFFKKQKNGKCV
jgi:hypothetical protein